MPPNLPAVLDLVRNLGADALHTFLLVPVGCGVDIAEAQMVPPRGVRAHPQLVLRSGATGDIELKATCAPHYFRVVRQRRAAERKAGGLRRHCRGSEQPCHWRHRNDDAGFDRHRL
jgi:MoaA/NifB/PqqE/SkfB family radical SAM enzyme